MGWSSHHATRYTKSGAIDRKAECAALFESSEGYEIVKSSMVGSVWYAAIRGKGKHKPVPEQPVWAAVVLTATDPQSYFNFSVKEMDETYGPVYYECPKSVLRALSETDNQAALEWRAKCWERHAEKDSPLAFRNLPEGASVLWTVGSDGWSGGLRKGEVVRLRKLRPAWGARCIWYAVGRGFTVDPKDVPIQEYVLEAEGAEAHHG